MYGLDLINTSVLGALGCDMAVFLRYFPAAETMYQVFVALAIGLILLIWILCPPEELVCQQETLEEILAVLALCTTIQRERFLLYALHDFSYAEIGRRCGCSKAAVHESIEGVRKKFFKFFR